ncbi:MAG: cytochrome c biogenesis protein CcdA [Candidatus Wallbacteria bacterium]|nr:cytochrome c biogenesis protein CcdA [Candidatus Wallbacteria bacterium]
MNLSDSLQQSLSSSSPLAFLIAFAGGLLTSLTPCIYPLIPVTIAFIGGLSRGNRRLAFLYSLVYTLGIAFIYAGLGAFAAVSGTMFGTWASSAWGDFLMANVCIIFALSFFGLFEINFNLVKGNIKSRNAFLLAFGTGALSALTASACTAPVLAVLLTYVARNQNIIYGTLLLFSFSIGLSLLLMLAGTFAGFLSSIPRAGRWMLAVKAFFGILLLLMGEYYLVRSGGKNFFSVTQSPIPVKVQISSVESAEVQAQTATTAEPGPALPESIKPEMADFTLPFYDNSGNQFNLYRSIGQKNLAFLFFATWCPSCMEELPQLSKIQSQFPHTRFIAVSNAESAQKISDAFAARGITVECVNDPDGAVFRQFNVNAIPAVLLIDRSGKQVLLGNHPVEKIEEELKKIDGK